MCLFLFQTQFFVFSRTALCSDVASQCVVLHASQDVKYVDVSPGMQMYFLANAFMQSHNVMYV